MEEASSTNERSSSTCEVIDMLVAKSRIFATAPMALAMSLVIFGAHHVGLAEQWLTKCRVVEMHLPSAFSAGAHMRGWVVCEFPNNVPERRAMLIVECHRRLRARVARRMFGCALAIDVRPPRHRYDVELDIPKELAHGRYEWKVWLKFRAGNAPPRYASTSCASIVSVRGQRQLARGMRARCEVRVAGRTMGLIWAALVDEGSGKVLSRNATIAMLKESGDEEHGFDGWTVIGVDVPESAHRGARLRWVAYIADLDKGRGEIASHFPQAKGNIAHITTRKFTLAQLEHFPSDIPGLLVPHVIERTSQRIRACINGFCEAIAVQRPTSLSHAERDNVIWSIKLPIPAHINPYEFSDFGVPFYRPGDERHTRWFWLRAKFIVPSEWRGRRIKLHFDGIHWTHQLYVNEKLVSYRGIASLQPVCVDITDIVHFAPQLNTMHILVGDAHFMLPRGGETQLVKIHPRAPTEHFTGIAPPKPGYPAIKDAFIEVVPNVHVDDVWVITSVRNRMLKVHAQVRNELDRPVRIRAFTRALDGVKEIKRTQAVSTVIPSHTVKRVTMQVRWRKPRFWSPEDPHLYTAEVTLLDERGRTVDVCRQRFGFREIWIDGGDLFLNGVKTHIRMPSSPDFALAGYHQFIWEPDYFRASIKVRKAVGFNAITMFHWSNWIAPRWAYDIADEMGMMIVQTLPMNSRALCDALWRGDLQLERLPVRDELEGVIKFLRNHPSIIIYELSNELLAYGGDSEGRRRWEKMMGKYFKLVHSFDHTRLMLDRGSGELFYSPLMDFHYFFESPHVHWDEREELISIWAHAKAIGKVKKAFKSGEVNMPTWRVDEIPLFAAYFGPRVYETYDVRGAKGNWHWSHFDAWLDSWCKHVTNIVRAWRYYGMSIIGIWRPMNWCGRIREDPYMAFREWREGKVVHAKMRERWNEPGYWHPRINLWGALYNPWDDDHPEFNPNRLYFALQRVLAPVLVFIGGPKEHPTWKDHAFFDDEHVTQSIVAINDRLRTVRVHYQWRAVDEVTQTSIANGKGTLSIAPGEVSVATLKFSAPKGRRRMVRITLDARDDTGYTARDEVTVDIFPRKPPPKIAMPVYLYDTVGITAKAFQRNRIDFARIDSMSELNGKRTGILVIGRESLHRRIFRNDALMNFLSHGGRMLIFEQTDASRFPENMRVRFVKAARREAFMCARSHPIFRGICEGDLRNWRGKSNLIRPECDMPEANRSLWIALRCSASFKVSNKGIVTSFPMRKPALEGIRCLLSTGYGLNLTPLVEYFTGNSIILVCQLDVTHRIGIDPVATRIVHNILQYLATVRVQYRHTIYIGDESSEELLRRAGIVYERANSIAEARYGDIVIIGTNLKRKQVTDLAKRVERMALRVVLLPRESFEALNNALPIHIRLSRIEAFHRVVFDEVAKGSPWLWGIGAEDLCFFDRKRLHDALVPCNLPRRGDVIASDPPAIAFWRRREGVIAIIQLPNDLLLGKALQVFRTLLCNLGVKFKASAPKELLAVPPKSKFITIDLRPYVTTSFVDDDEPGNKKGGWTDQGYGTDLWDFPLGKQVFGGVPFDIIDPKRNRGKSCILLASRWRPYFPKAVRGIKIGMRADVLHFLITAACCRGHGYEAARIVVHYEDGTQVKIPLLAGVHIGEWWGPTFLDEAETVWEGIVPRPRNVFRYGWKNAHPDKVIATLDFESVWDGRSDFRVVPALIAITAEVYERASQAK